jgi:hypothetical protein
VRNTSEKGPVIVGELELVVALDAGDFGVCQARPISYRPVWASRRVAPSPSRIPSLLIAPEHYADEAVE